MRIEDFKTIKKFDGNSSRYAQLTFAMNEAKLPGSILEFGVFKANSTNHIAKLRPKTKIYAFDSFEGLPEKWVFSGGITRPKGTFALEELPEVVENVKLVKGWFKDTIPKWKKEHKASISFIHIDSDIYSSCVTILTELNTQIVPGTIIVFDELFKGPHYENWREHEWKALNEWCEEFNRECKAMSKTTRFAATIKVIK